MKNINNKKISNLSDINSDKNESKNENDNNNTCKDIIDQIKKFKKNDKIINKIKYNGKQQYLDKKRTKPNICSKWLSKTL